MICNDLKFHDMQNNTEYLLLQSVLKDQQKMIVKQEKRLMKLKKKPEPQKKTHSAKKSSKFKEKYSDRVESIQSSDAKTLENRRIAAEIEKMEQARKTGNNIGSYDDNRDINRRRVPRRKKL